MGDTTNVGNVSLGIGLTLPGEAGVIAIAKAVEANAPVALAFIGLLTTVLEKVQQPQAEALARLIESWAALEEKRLVPLHLAQDWINAQIAALAKKEG
jgi:hypothetical protein